MGTYAGQTEFPRLEKSLFPFIFLREKSPCPVIFFFRKSACPVIFPVKSVFAPSFELSQKHPSNHTKRVL